MNQVACTSRSGRAARAGRRASASLPFRRKGAALAAAFAVAALGAAAPPVSAAPLWEAGAGVGLLSLPDYRGSDQRHSYALPFPYFVYRGERLHVDRQGLRAKLFDIDRLLLDASFTGNFALRSADNLARAGMPALHPIVEGGPELVFTLLPSSSANRTVVDLRLATRAAFSIGGGRIAQQGWTASPYLRLHNHNLGGYDVSATLGALYGSARYHAYLYSVDPVYSTGSRPAYSAPGGYAGAFVQLGAGRRFGRFWVGGYVRHDSLRGASFEASPLVRTTGYTAGGLAFSWVFASSSQEGRDDD